MSSSPVIRKSMRHQLVWTLPAQLVSGLAGFVLLIALTKLGGNAVVGQYGLLLAITGPILVFADFRLNTILATDHREAIPLRDYVCLRVLLLCAANAVVGIVAVSYVIAGQASFALLLGLTTLMRSVESFSELCCGVQQRLQRMDRIAFSLGARGFLSTATAAMTYWASRDLVSTLAVMILSRLVILMAYDIPVARSVVDNGPFRSHVASGFPNLRIKKLFLVGAPLGIAAILISLTMNIPRYALSIHSGLTTLGVFFQMTLIIQAGDRFFRAIEQPFTPRMAEYLRKGEKKRFWNLLTKTTLLLVMAGTVAAVICFAGGPVVWSTIYSGNPDGLGFALAGMAVATCVAHLAGLIDACMVAARRTAIQLPCHLLTVLSCLAICRLLIPVWGLHGGVLALVFCRFPFIVIGVLLLRHELAGRAEASELPNAVEWKSAA